VHGLDKIEDFGGKVSKMLSNEAKRELIQIVRESTLCALSGTGPLELGTESLVEENRQSGRGIFVSMYNQNSLRGCIGCFENPDPLYQIAIDYAAHACRDPRFVSNPVTQSELDDIHFEVSVIQPLEWIQDPMDIEIGVHGIGLESSRARGVFLPQVATEYNMDKEEFWKVLAQEKAGIDPALIFQKDPSLRLFRFEAEVFKESDLAREG